MSETNRFQFWINIALVLLLLVVVIQKYTEPKDLGNYNLCVEWGDVYYQDLMWKCYNFMQQKIVCDWDIDYDTQVLTFYQYRNNSNIYSQHECTLYAKTVRVERNETISFKGMPGFD